MQELSHLLVYGELGQQRIAGKMAESKHLPEDFLAVIVSLRQEHRSLEKHYLAIVDNAHGIVEVRY